MSQILSSSDRVTKRCLRACARCRDMKVRCSGHVPCNRCQKSGEPCYFKAEDSRISVPQSYLQSLEDRARGDHLPGLRPTSPKRGLAISPPQSTARSIPPHSARATSNVSTRKHSPSRGSHMSERLCVPTFDQEEHDYSPNDSAHNVFISNPLVDNGETFSMDPTGKYWYMGPTSSWAFCRRVLAIIGDRMPIAKHPVSPWDLETVHLDWSPIGLKEAPDVDNLPSRDYAIFLAYTVKYHLGSLYEIIDHDVFHRHLHAFYDNPPEVVREHRYWFSQFLFVLAFGEAFSKTESNESVPGLSYASRALSLIPTLVPIDRGSLPAVEALCLAALYLQSVDLRLMAFQLIGQALRISVIEGWHRHMPPEEVGAAHSKRCNTIFWTAYIIDREFGTLVGAPTTIRDEDVTTRLPSAIEDSARASALSLQIRLSRLTATILTGVYGVDRYFNGSLITDTQSVLQDLAAVSRDLSTYLDTELRGTEISTSKVATRLIISYHHCVVLTTRPLVMCILQRRLAKHDENTSIPQGPINTLFSACTDSAFSILNTLKTLGDRNLLDSFLPFQLESAFSSAFLLYVIDAVAPDFVSDKSWLPMAHGIFELMISRGSPAAQLRKREFARLEQIMIEFMQTNNAQYDPSAYDHAAHHPGSETEKADTTVEEADGAMQNNQQQQQHQQPQQQNFTDDMPNNVTEHDEEQSWDLLGNFGEFTMSPTLLLNLAEDLQVEDFM